MTRARAGLCEAAGPALRRFRAALLRGALLAALALLMVQGATAQTSADTGCTLPPMRTGDRPDPDGPPTEVQMGIIVGDILDIDDVEQQISGDFFGTIRWVDPRLEGLEGCSVERALIWTPPITMINSARLTLERTQARDRVVIGPGGAVRYDQRYRGEISTYHVLRRFPFDKQEFQIVVGSVVEGPEALVLVPLEGASGLANRLNIEGWDIQGYRVETATMFLPVLNDERSLFALTISAQRETSFYVFRLLLPLALIVTMSWAAFWVPAEKFDLRLGLGATSMLTVIAFQLAAASYLPRLGYMTKLDGVLIWATITVFLCIACTILSWQLVARNQSGRAVRLDQMFRILVPVVFALGWAAIILA